MFSIKIRNISPKERLQKGLYLNICLVFLPAQHTIMFACPCAGLHPTAIPGKISSSIITCWVSWASKILVPRASGQIGALKWVCVCLLGVLNVCLFIWGFKCVYVCLFGVLVLFPFGTLFNISWTHLRIHILQVFPPLFELKRIKRKESQAFLSLSLKLQYSTANGQGASPACPSQWLIPGCFLL